MSSRIIGMGETVMDILFHQPANISAIDSPQYIPFASVPGGSTFNSLISVGRSGVPCMFMGYTGNNRVGQDIAAFLKENNISTEYFQLRPHERAALSLAYLDSNGDADYTFYKEEPTASSYSLPQFTPMDYLLYGSYYSICPGLRSQVLDTVQSAHDAGTLIYYDVNFRQSHQPQLDDLLPRIQENCRLSTIVRGSADDFRILFDCTAPQELYSRYISDLCPVFICTAGPGLVVICCPTGIYDFHVPTIPSHEIVSTVGAGDSFNAGILCAMHAKGIRSHDIAALGYTEWESLVANGIKYSSQVCRSMYNYIPSPA